jgi:hypothetical protein
MLGKLPESSGDNLGPALDRFEAEFGFHGAAWCGIFAGHALEAAGLKVPHEVASVAAILQLAQDGNGPFVKGVLPISQAQPGDLATFGGAEHVAIITKVDAAGVHTIAGNTGQNNVSETIYPPGAVTGVVRPDYAHASPYSQLSGWDQQLAGPGASEPVVGSPAVAAPAAAPAAPPIPGAAPDVAGASAIAPGASAPGTPPQAGTAEFAALGHPGRGAHRATVQFLQAVRPDATPGAPAAGGPVSPGTAASAPAGSGAAAQGPPSTPGAAADVHGAGAVAAAAGGSISVSSSLLTPGQAKFAARLAELTGLDPHVIAAWQLAEESGGAAAGREAASNFNWLNIGYFDSGAGRIAFDRAFGDPVSAAEQTAKFLKGEWGGASPSIRAIIGTAGQPPAQQMQAIANSDWASTHYDGGANLRGTFDELKDIQVTRA